MSRLSTRPRRSDYPCVYALTTRWGDHDSYGHVQNVVYYSFFDSAVSQFLVERDTLDIADSTVIGLIVASNCTYFASITFPDRVSVGLRIACMGTSSVRYELGVFRNNEDEACAMGELVYVYVDRSSRLSTPIPSTIRAELNDLL